MNSEKTDFNKIELIRKLEILRELEMKKPINEIDTDFIDEIVLFGLELKGLKATLTPEEVEEKVRKIPFVEKTTTLNTPPTSVKGRATKVKSHKILLIAAIISILVAIFATISVAFECNIFDELKNRFGTVADTPINQVVDVGEITVISNGKFYPYNSLEEALKKEKIDVLYPKRIPQNISLNQIVFDEIDSLSRVSFVFNNSDFTFTIVFNGTLPQEVLSNNIENVEINNIDCYIIDMPDIGMTQIYFEHNGNLYKLRYNNKQDLISVIESLKELQ